MLSEDKMFLHLKWPQAYKPFVFVAVLCYCCFRFHVDVSREKENRINWNNSTTETSQNTSQMYNTVVEKIMTHFNDRVASLYTF